MQFNLHSEDTKTLPRLKDSPKPTLVQVTSKAKIRKRAKSGEINIARGQYCQARPWRWQRCGPPHCSRIE